MENNEVQGEESPTKVYKSPSKPPKQLKKAKRQQTIEMKSMSNKILQSPNNEKAGDSVAVNSNNSLAGNQNLPGSANTSKKEKVKSKIAQS